MSGRWTASLAATLLCLSLCITRPCAGETIAITDPVALGITAFVVNDSDPAALDTGTPQELTKYLCDELLKSDVMTVVLFPDQEPRVRFLLRGAIEVRGNKLTPDLEIVDADSGEIVKRIRANDLTLGQTKELITTETPRLAGDIVVSSTPLGAEIMSGEQRLGPAPVTLSSCPYGTYKLGAELEGYESVKSSLQHESPLTTIRLALEPVQQADEREPRRRTSHTHRKTPDSESLPVGEPVKPSPVVAKLGRDVARSEPKRLYADFHYGFGYWYGVPTDDPFESIVSDCHSVSLDLGVSLHFLRLQLEGVYGWTGYGVRGERSAITFVDGGDNEIGINWIRRAGIGGDASIMLPLGRTREGYGIYPYVGIGYRFESILIRPLEPWVGADGDVHDYETIIDPIAVENNHRYWTAGLTVGGVNARFRGGLDDAATGWWEAGLSVQNVHVDPHAGQSRVRQSRLRPLYTDVHWGVGYSYAAPTNDHLRMLSGGCHSGTLGLGACIGYLRIQLEGGYGVTSYGAKGGDGAATFIDGVGNEIPVDWIHRASCAAELAFMVPTSRTRSGAAIYPYAGVGRAADVFLVRPGTEWVSEDGTLQDYDTLQDAITIANEFTYWTIGYVHGALNLRLRSSIDELHTGWWEFGIGFQATSTGG